MAYNYLGLVNDVCGRVNETPLTSSTFPSAAGFYSTVKEGINSSIRDLNQQTFQWPFNFVEQEDILTAGTVRYPYPTDAKNIDFNTFRIKRNSTFNNTTTMLNLIDYNEYLEQFIDDEYNTTDTSIRNLPRLVARTPSKEYVLHPSPDQAYELVYEYYSVPTDLELYTDVPTAPESFRHTLVDGAMYYVYHFRGDTDTADRLQAKFIDGIERLRILYINSDYEYVRDTRVPHRSPYGSNMKRTA